MFKRDYNKILEIIPVFIFIMVTDVMISFITSGFVMLTIIDRIDDKLIALVLTITTAVFIFIYLHISHKLRAYVRNNLKQGK